MTKDLITQPENNALPASQADMMLNIIREVALNPEADIEKMERLLVMQEKIFQRNAEIAFNQALAAAQAEIPPIKKNKKNLTTNSPFADLEQVNRIAVPIITKHGFSISFGTEDSPRENHYRMNCLLSHVEGHSRKYFADIPADTVGIKGQQNKTATHGFGSTITYGQRYLVKMIFNITLTDEDNDGNGGQLVTITEAQFGELETLLGKFSDKEGQEKSLLAYYGVEHLTLLPAARFSQVRSALVKKLNNLSKGS